MVGGVWSQAALIDTEEDKHSASRGVVSSTLIWGVGFGFLGGSGLVEFGRTVGAKRGRSAWSVLAPFSIRRGNTCSSACIVCPCCTTQHYWAFLSPGESRSVEAAYCNYNPTITTSVFSFLEHSPPLRSLSLHPPPPPLLTHPPRLPLYRRWHEACSHCL